MLGTQPAPSSVNNKLEIILLKIYFWCFVIDQRLQICEMILNEISFMAKYKISAKQPSAVAALSRQNFRHHTAALKLR